MFCSLAWSGGPWATSFLLPSSSKSSSSKEFSYMVLNQGIPLDLWAKESILYVHS